MDNLKKLEDILEKFKNMSDEDIFNLNKKINEDINSEKKHK